MKRKPKPLDQIVDQAESRREFDRQIKNQVHDAIEMGCESITIHFEALAEQSEHVTLRNLWRF